MIVVTQGHELAIGLEVFLKAFLILSPRQQKKFLLCCFPSSLENTLKTLGLHYQIRNDILRIGQSSLSLKCLTSTRLPQSTIALETALELLSGKDILLTLPTSKDSLIIKSKQGGHTDFFRSYYKNNQIHMTFFDQERFLLLMTEHISLDAVSSSLTSENIASKVINCTQLIEQYFCPIKEVNILGVHPHCGENGIIGDDNITKKASHTLAQRLKKKINGPLSGDTMAFHFKKNSLTVAMHHDQGLGPFKALTGYSGIHATLGLPFHRFSLDHGTAFSLYGKNSANAMGTYKLLRYLIRYEENL